MLKKHITEQDVKYLENLINEFDAELPKLTHFIVPATKPAAAFLNLARTVCRRAERWLWALYRRSASSIKISSSFSIGWQICCLR